MSKCVILVFCLIFVASHARPNDEKYTTKYDNVDVDGILKSERLLGNYVNCLLDRGNCGPDAKELKSILSDALETECQKCSEVQKDKSKQVIEFLYNKKPGIWKELEDKYDPTGTFRSKYEVELSKVKKD